MYFLVLDLRDVALPTYLAMNQTARIIISCCLNFLVDVIELAWSTFCAATVVSATLMKERTLLGRVLLRMTFISGRSDDTNARLCLFLRALYTMAPPPFTHDAQEAFFAKAFLHKYHLAFLWIVKQIGIRGVPPPLRPLYVNYQVRALEVAKFLDSCMMSKGVTQIVIIGAGFDTFAYRTRSRRIDPSQDRYVSFFEIDRGRVQREKLRLLKEYLTEGELTYFLEGVRFVECELGTDSLTDALLQSGFDRHLNTAIVWEGVTYYLSREEVNSTLQELYVLLHETEIKANLPQHELATLEPATTSTLSGLSSVTPMPFRPEPKDSSPIAHSKGTREEAQSELLFEKNIADGLDKNMVRFLNAPLSSQSGSLRSSQTASSAQTASSRASPVQAPASPCVSHATTTTSPDGVDGQEFGKCYLFLDYMRPCNRADLPWLWQKSLELLDMTGNGLRTTFENMSDCLAPYEWRVESVKTSVDTMKEIIELNNPYFKLVIDTHTQYLAKCKPEIATVECQLNRQPATNSGTKAN